MLLTRGITGKLVQKSHYKLARATPVDFKIFYSSIIVLVSYLPSAWTSAGRALTNPTLQYHTHTHTHY